MIINYESEIEQIIFDTLKYIYGIKDDDILYRYLKLRHRCLNPPNKNSNEISMLGKFLLDELYITKLTYNKEKIFLYNEYANSIKNIVDSLEFRSKLNLIIDENNKKYSFNEYIENTWNFINEKAIKKAKHYLKDEFYKYHLIYHRLNILNTLFGVSKVKEVPVVTGFIQDLSQNVSIEEKCLRYIHASNFKTNNTNTIKEENLEEFLFKNLQLIEYGLIPIQRQFEIKDGVVDILAKDKEGNYVIIELKINNDKHLIWQSMYYPNAVKSKMKTDNVRMITICPSYPDYIKIPLTELNYVEMIEYKVIINNNKISSISFYSKEENKKLKDDNAILSGNLLPKIKVN